MKKILSIGLIFFILCSCQKNVEGKVRGDVTQLGLDEALLSYVADAKSGSGEDLFKFYWLLQTYSYKIPEYKYSSTDKMDSILNCAAETGFRPAVRRGLFRIRASHKPEAMTAAQCVSNTPYMLESSLGRAWRNCRADEFLDSCPDEFKIYIR